ncbi:MAG: NAD(P)H-quinone oxidoreductase subunit F [Leptolyngbyaceae bacterium]|nr:NAD(P)H-quinone oxidoreductase subunit F [Leptolyngbyaceae bacterium]
MNQLLLESIWLIPCYALIGTIASTLWFPAIIRRTGPRPAGYINLFMTLMGFVHGLAALQATWNQPAQEFFFSWLKVAHLDLTLSIEVSSLTVGATVLVTGLNLLAQIYAIGYLEMDWGWARFFSLLAFFEMGICTLALCNSLFFSYIFLEILTLGTYLLLGFWFNQSLVVTGARDAFLTKRVGDLVLLMGVVALLPLAGTWNFSELAIWAKTATLDPKVATLLGLALIAGPIGKCAQFPLHLWLDEAMEGPIPSTILRNSVVVATGAWVLIKLEPILALSPVVMATLVGIGAVTAIGASFIAIAQIDVKRALSYSVSAYMGLVFIAVGTQQTEAALLLLLTHAVAMALLIMGIGSIIWGNITQDLTQFGGLWSRRPISGIAFLVGAAGLIACPPFGSFWALLELTNGLWVNHPWLLGLVLGVNGITAFSLTRVFCLIFAGQPQQMTERSPEVHWPMAFPMIVLLGFVLHLPLVLQASSLLPAVADLNSNLALVLIWSTITGGSLGAVVYLGKTIPKPVQLPWKGLQDLLAYDFYTAKLYRVTIVFLVSLISNIAFWLDRYVFDGVANLLGLATIVSGQGLKYSTSGQVQFYVMTIVIGAVVVGGIVIWTL